MHLGKFILPFLLFLFCAGVQAQYLTYNSDIKPIINKNCAGCHREGDIGPMPLTTYEEVAAYGKMIQFVTASRLMPPWYADTSYSHFSGERVLSRDQIQTIRDWVENGMIEGALPYGQVISSAASVTVLPRKPDLVLTMNEAFEQFGIYLDQYQAFVIPTHLTEDKFVEGIEFIPGNKKIVRYASISLAPAGDFDSLDHWDPRYGYYSFGGLGKTPDQPYWYTWSPQQKATYFPEETGKLLPKNSDLILHIHYGPTGRPQDDSSQIRLYFTSKKFPLPQLTAPLINPYGLTNGTFYIPANTKKTFHAEYTLPYAIQLKSLTPQANLLCRSWEMYARIPGDPIPVRLLKIKDWNFNWKQTYRFASPIFLPEGAVIHALAVYDNTLENPCNPSDKPKEVTWGAHLFNELFFVHCEFATEALPENGIMINAPAVANDPFLPVNVEVTKKGYYRFDIVNTVDHVTVNVSDFTLTKEKETIKIPIGKFVNGNYVLNVFNEKNELVARQLFVKMWEKGM